MAAQIGADVVNTAVKSRADKIVFADKPIDVDLPQSDKGDSSSSKGSTGSDTPITPKDFYWDQILFYLVSAILGLSFLDISVEFFRGSVIQCFAPNVTQRDQAAYLNNYCYDSLPHSQYYLIFILISALVIIAPHYLWMSYFGAHFDFFFDLVKKLNRLRDTNTGEYSPYNFELVKKLEQKFSSSSPWIFRLYKSKLLLQFVFCVVVLLVNILYFDKDDFEESFPCPSDINLVNSPAWPFDIQFYCVYNSLQLLYFLRNTALGLVSAAILVIVFGLIWCHVCHTTELGAQDIAAFCDVSCLPPEEYPFPSYLNTFKKVCCRKKVIATEMYQTGQREQDVYSPMGNSPKIQQGQEGETDDDSRMEDPQRIQERQEETDDDEDSECEMEEQKCVCCCPKHLKQQNFSIKTDLDFLVTRLFYADSGHGEVFKEIQIQKELNEKISQDHKLLYLLNRVQSHLLDKAMKDAMQNGERVSNEDYYRTWERSNDFRDYFFKSNFSKDKTKPEDLVYSFFKSKMGVTLKDWSHSPLRSVLFGFLHFAPRNQSAFDISYGTRTGHSLILARAFYHVATFHFNKHYRNSKDIYREDNYQANYKIFTYQEDIFSQNAHNVTQSEKVIVDFFNEGTKIRKLDLIVIGPMTDRSKISTTNLLIEKIHARKAYFRERAIILAIRPLMIGHTPCSKHFIQYQPPKGIFENIKEEVCDYLESSQVIVYSVSPKGDINRIDRPTQIYNEHSTMKRRSRPYGLAVECNNVSCIYEFRVFRLIDTDKVTHTSAIVQTERSLQTSSSPLGTSTTHTTTDYNNSLSTDV